MGDYATRKAISDDLNGRYGAHGLMKLSAVRRYPRRIIHRKRIARLMRTTNDKH